jgi:hypothetical protein
VIPGAVIIKCYSAAAFVDESRYNAPLRAQSTKDPKRQDSAKTARQDGAKTMTPGNDARQ